MSFFGDGASIWETVAAAMAAKMIFLRHVRYCREGELLEETA